MLKIIGKLLSYIGMFFAILLAGTTNQPAVHDGYEETVESGGFIEDEYLNKGSYDVSYFEEDTSEFFDKYEVSYPSELETGDLKYPVIVVANGTATAASTYKPLFEHYASWGFVVIGNEDEGSWSGESTEKCLEYLIEKNEDKDSIFYDKLDFERVGITGHSQGGAAVINAMTKQPNGDMYKAAALLSPANEELSDKLGWSYDAGKINVPVFIGAGTSGEFETETVIPFEKLELLYSHINSPKVMMRRTGIGHGRTLYYMSGYVTAWFRWQLCGDMEAAKAFVGDNPEILDNKLYQDQRIDLE